MKNAVYRLMIGFWAVWLCCGCATVLVAGGAAVGAGAGTYLYVNGEMKAEYMAPFDQVWSACEKTIAELRGTEVQPDKEIARGKMTAVINDEKVTIQIVYRAKNQTTVGIRVGLMGNKMSSQLLHDKIAAYLANSGS